LTGQRIKGKTIQVISKGKEPLIKEKREPEQKKFQRSGLVFKRSIVKKVFRQQDKKGRKNKKKASKRKGYFDFQSAEREVKVNGTDPEREITLDRYSE